MIRVPSSVFRLACIVTLLVPLLGTMAYGGSPGAIAEADILSLQEKLAFSGDSTVAVRIAMKNVARRRKGKKRGQESFSHGAALFACGLPRPR
jgi:hypothetical protein